MAPNGIVATGWPAVHATCTAIGLDFDQWQVGLNKLLLAKRVDGLYAADLFLLSIPRQTGKTYDIGAVVFALAINNPGLTVIWTAHRTRTAGETFRSMQGFTKRDKIAPHVLGVTTGNGKEAVHFVNGSRILFGARERGFGRGFADVDVLIFDEAQILSESAIDDMVPATNVAKNPLIILAGTPPKPTDPGEVFTTRRAEALEGEVEDVGYVEISADENADPLDREQWRIMNPSYPHRTSERAILRMFKALSLDSFRREAMGIWDAIERHMPVVGQARWRDLADVGPEDGTKPNALGVDMSHARDISVSGCWIEGESAHTEELWAGSDPLAAVEWIVERAGRRIPVVIDSASPAASLVLDLQAKKVKVRVTTAGDMAKACGGFQNRTKVDPPLLSHGGQPRVTDALKGGRKRPIGTAGGWGWDRRDPTCVIHPIVSTTLALFGATENPRRTSSSGGAMSA